MNLSLKDLLLAQVEREAPGTRAALERLPEGKDDWKPHPKSMAMGALAGLVASMPSWFSLIIDTGELDLARPYTGSPARTKRELIQGHDEALEKARRSFSNTSDEHLLTHWRLLYGEKVLDDRPRHLIIADTVGHLAHHRGQLTVYLRLNEQPVPAIYGASADQGW
jgi:uncharacterized damage-inducible protein DinB